MDEAIDRNSLEEKAKQILRETEFFGIMPVDILQIANVYGIEVFEASLDSLTSGFIKMTSNNNFEIVLRNSDSKERKRFTLAHEVAHFILHKHKFTANKMHIDRLNRDDNIDSKEEKEANYFAGALLMQEENVIKLLDANISIHQMSEAFEVSESAMNSRIAEMRMTSEA